ncbi:MAG: hypothetical protein ACC648_00755 [Thiohalobacterales bacterium]
MNRFHSALLVFTLGILLTGPATADVLLVDEIESASAADTPGTGMNMDSVRAKYGNPVQEYPAVSTSGHPQHPPITRWDYNDYSVFFENDLVLHSVVYRAGAK